MQNETLMVSISGIRGIVGRGFDGFIVQKYITAFATLLIQEKKENNEQLIVLGRDSRVSGPWINPIVEGVRESKKKKNIEKKIVKKKKDFDGLWIQSDKSWNSHYTNSTSISTKMESKSRDRLGKKKN